MIVYRIEDEDGYGPYNSDLDVRGPVEIQILLSRLNKEHSECRPTLYYDVSYTHREKYLERCIWLCCCDSVCKLKDWFEGFYQSLLFGGFVVNIYEVTDINDLILTDSGKQLAFRKDGSSCNKLGRYTDTP